MEEFSIGAFGGAVACHRLSALAVGIDSELAVHGAQIRHQTLFIMAIVIFTAGTLLGALAVNFPMLLAARLVMSLGTGISLPLITNIHWHEEA